MDIGTLNDVHTLEDTLASGWNGLLLPALRSGAAHGSRSRLHLNLCGCAQVWPVYARYPLSHRTLLLRLRDSLTGYYFEPELRSNDHWLCLCLD